MKEISIPIKFEIGDEVTVHSSFGDYDEGTVMGVKILVSYIVRLEYGYDIHTKEENIVKKTNKKRPPTD